ncbi:acetolactate synthase small subunit [Candidatus Omnitrophota bacterium]
MEHTISVLVENKPGVLARISGLFSARGYNITSLAVGETDDPSVSRMTMVVDAPSEKILEQILKQLHRLIDTVAVDDFTKKDYIGRELILVKVGCSKEDRPTIKKLLEKYHAKIDEKKEETIVVEASLEVKQINGLLEKLKPFGIKELVRTGRIAIVR